MPDLADLLELEALAVLYEAVGDDTNPAPEHPDARAIDTMLLDAMAEGGAVLLALARDEAHLLAITHLTTRDGRLVEPWVLMVQIINHATEHREQLKSMLSALGITPPDLDAWTYGEATGALGPAGP